MSAEETMPEVLAALREVIEDLLERVKRMEAQQGGGRMSNNRYAITEAQLEQLVELEDKAKRWTIVNVLMQSNGPLVEVEKMRESFQGQWGGGGEAALRSIRPEDQLGAQLKAEMAKQMAKLDQILRALQQPVEPPQQQEKL